MKIIIRNLTGLLWPNLNFPPSKTSSKPIRRLVQKIVMIGFLGVWSYQGLAQVPELMYYQFENGSTSVANHALTPVGTNPAPILGTLNTSGTGQFGSGLTGAAGTGAADYVNTGWATNLTGSWTMSFYMANWNGTAFHYILGDNTAGNLRVFAAGAAGSNNITLRGPVANVNVTGVASGSFVIHFVYDASIPEIRAYKNGVLNATVAQAALNITGTGPFKIGAQGSSAGLPLGMVLDEFRLYNRALSATEILNTYNVNLNVSGGCANSFTNFAVDSVKATTAKVNWTPGSGNSSFYLEYGLSGFLPGTGTKLTGTYPGLQPPVYLTGLMSDTIYDVYFGEICNSGMDSIFFPSPQTFRTTPLCPAPTGMTLTMVGDTFVTGTVTGPGAPYDFIWGPAGFNQGSPGTGFKTSGLPFTIDSLLFPGGTFDVYVRSNCGTQGVSPFFGPITFITNCTKKTLPYSENFNVNLGCMKVVNGGADTASWQWQPTGGSATPGDLNGSGYAGVDSDEHGQFTYMREMLESPAIDAGNLTGALVVEFDQFYQNIGADSAAVQVFDGTSWVNVLVMKQTTGAFSNPNHQYLNVTQYANANFQVRFLYDDGNTWAWWWLIDNFTVREVQCAPSTAFVNNYIGPDTASFTWTAGTATRFMIEYGTTGFTPGTGTRVMTSGAPFSVNGLLPQTTYDFYLIDSCATGFADTLGPRTITTSCLVQNLPYIENFNANLGCMNAINGGASAATWEWEPMGGTTVNGDLDGTGFAVVNSDQYGASAYMREILASPPINAGSLPATSALILEFDHFFQWVFSNDSGSVEVFDGTNWVSIYTVKATTGAFSAPDHQRFDVTAHANANFQVRFVYDDGNVWAWWWLVDNLSVTEALCGIASNPDTLSVGVDSAQLSWNSNGGNWNINWGPAGFSQGSGAGFFAKNVTTNPYTLTGLTKSTCYDYYVQDTCLGIGSGAWAGPFTFCTKAACPAPGSINATAITTTTATISWNPGGQATNYNMEYGPAGFVRGTGTMINTTAPTTNLTGLIASTAYHVFVRDSCGAGDVSLWTGPYKFNTVCATITAPIMEDFQTHTLGFFEGEDNCWTLKHKTVKTSATSGFGWDLRNVVQNTSVGTGASGDNTLWPAIGGQFFNADVSYGVSGDSSMLISPFIDISSLSVPELKYHIHRMGTQMAAFYVDIFNGTSWVKGVHSYISLTGIQTTQTAAYKDTTISLMPYVGSTNFRVRFRVVSNGCCAGDNSLDDISIYDVANCVAPSNVVTTAIACDSIKVGWNNDGDSTIVAYGPTGGLPTGTVLVTTDSTGFITGTMANTSYDVYLSNICNGDTSTIVGPITINTGTAGYPVASFTATSPGLNTTINFDASASTGGTSYSWDFGDGSPAGSGVAPSHTYANGGAYCVKLTVTNRCGSSDTTICLNDVSLVENALSRSLEVFPNPAKERVMVSFTSENGKQASIRILDPSGKVVMQLKQGITRSEFETEINLSGLADGVYLMEISDGSLQTNHRLIKQ